MYVSGCSSGSNADVPPTTSVHVKCCAIMSPVRYVCFRGRKNGSACHVTHVSHAQNKNETSLNVLGRKASLSHTHMSVTSHYHTAAASTVTKAKGRKWCSEYQKCPVLLLHHIEAHTNRKPPGPQTPKHVSHIIDAATECCSVFPE